MPKRKAAPAPPKRLEDLTPEERKVAADNAWRWHPGMTAQVLTSFKCGACNHPDRDDIEHSCWRKAAHLSTISKSILDVVYGEEKRLIVEAPPRHGKSHLISWWTPVFFLNNFPHKRVMLGTYEADFAATWGRKVRDTIMDPDYAKALNVKISDASQAVDNWMTTAGGGMTCAGVGGPFTGKGADLLLIDDPIKNAAEASSELRRDQVWEWAMSAAFTRVEPGGGIIITMTRWHEDDLIGRLKKRMREGGQQWKVLSLPAIAETTEHNDMGAGNIDVRPAGEPLWPERWSLRSLREKKAEVGSWTWSALYQQRPTRPEGNFFKRAWFQGTVQRVEVPHLKRIVRRWDLAATTEGEKGNEDPDYTAGVKMGVSDAGVCYVLDLKHVRSSPGEVERLIKRTASDDGYETAIRIEQEPGSAGKALISHYARDVLAGYDCRGVPSTGEKLVRAGPFNAACERGDVKLVGGNWVETWLSEVCEFPNSAHDDIVDASVGAYQDLTRGAEPYDLDELARGFAGGRSSRARPAAGYGRQFAGRIRR